MPRDETRERPIIFTGESVRSIIAGTKTQTRRICKHRHGIRFVGGKGQENNPSCWGYFFDGPSHHGWAVLARGLNEQHDNGCVSIPCPYGEAGDRLWVREGFWIADYYSWGTCPSGDELRAPPLAQRKGTPVCYVADSDPPNTPNRTYPNGLTGGAFAAPNPYAIWRKYPSLHMPRWASRLTLEVVSVRVERLRDISEDDAKAEGITRLAGDGWSHPYILAFRSSWDRINSKRAPWTSNPWVWVMTFRKIEPCKS